MSTSCLCRRFSRAEIVSLSVECFSIKTKWKQLRSHWPHLSLDRLAFVLWPHERSRARANLIMSNQNISSRFYRFLHFFAVVFIFVVISLAGLDSRCVDFILNCHCTLSEARKISNRYYLVGRKRFPFHSIRRCHLQTADSRWSPSSVMYECN